MCKNSFCKTLYTKVAFLRLGFKGFTAFRNVCKELGSFSNVELWFFWNLDSYNYATYIKVNKVLDQLKAE